MLGSCQTEPAKSFGLGNVKLRAWRKVTRQVPGGWPHADRSMVAAAPWAPAATAAPARCTAAMSFAGERFGGPPFGLVPRLALGCIIIDLFKKIIIVQHLWSSSTVVFLIV